MGNKYRLHEFAKKIHVSANTLRRWDASGKLVAKRSQVAAARGTLACYQVLP